MEKQVAIVGSGVSGLLACKYLLYLLEKGYDPIVLEGDETIGGVWAHTPESTRLQSVKRFYQFSDFQWPPSVTDMNPTHTQIMDYLQSYATRFGILPRIRFNSKVLGIEYVGESYEEMQSWHLWGGTGKAFGSKGKWHIRVQNPKTFTIQEYRVGFIILCIGQFSGVPNIPDEFPPNKGPQVFRGKVIHSADYGAMKSSSVRELIEGKRVAIIGSHKSAADIAAECATANGIGYQCTMIQRTPHWSVPIDYTHSHLAAFFFTQFMGLFFHKPGETSLLRLLGYLLFPLKWGVSKLAEMHLKWKFPLKKYEMIPTNSLIQELAACIPMVLPDKFYDRVEEGSIIIKNSQCFSFHENGLIINGKDELLETDVVIFATGYRGDLKLKNIFESPILKEWIMGSPKAPIPLYRQIIHPLIPRLAIIGYGESTSILTTSEIRCQWVAHLLEGNVRLPCVRDMEKEVKMLGEHIKQVAGKYYRKSSTCSSNIWYNDQLCKDIGCNPRRKNGFFADWFLPYEAKDYAGLVPDK